MQFFLHFATEADRRVQTSAHVGNGRNVIWPAARITVKPTFTTVSSTVFTQFPQQFQNRRAVNTPTNLVNKRSHQSELFTCQIYTPTLNYFVMFTNIAISSKLIKRFFWKFLFLFGRTSCRSFFPWKSLETPSLVLIFRHDKLETLRYLMQTWSRVRSLLYKKTKFSLWLRETSYRTVYTIVYYVSEWV